MSIHKIVDVNTGEETLVDYTKEELAEQKSDQKLIEANLAKEAENAVAKAAVLSKLGLTAEEAAILLK
jgi:hypothetical protein